MAEKSYTDDDMKRATHIIRDILGLSPFDGPAWYEAVAQFIAQTRADERKAIYAERDRAIQTTLETSRAAAKATVLTERCLVWGRGWRGPCLLPRRHKGSCVPQTVPAASKEDIRLMAKAYGWGPVTISAIEAIVARTAADEREACARALEEEGQIVEQEVGGFLGEMAMYDVCAAVVRGDRRGAPLRADMATAPQCGARDGAYRCVGRPHHDGGHDMKPVHDPIDRPAIVIVPAPGDRCGNTGRLPDGTPCPGCRACQ